MKAPPGLRDQLQAAALAALAREGATFTRAKVVAAFEGRGVSRPTIYRWIAQRLAPSDGSQDASGADANRIGSLLADIRARADALPDTLDCGAIGLRLVEIIGTAVALVRAARGPGGQFVKPRLALDALELLRRTLMNAADLATLDAGAGDAVLREPIVHELATLLDPPGVSATAAMGSAP